MNALDRDNADYDAVVVGARVAGASTAMLLARRGHRVLLVDRAGPPADTLSTHALLRPAVVQLSRWGLLDSIIALGTPPIRHVTLGFGDELVPFALRDKSGVDVLYAPRRTVIDGVLLGAAVDAGAVWHATATVTDVIRSASGRVTGVSIRTPEGTHDITANFVVGADGTRSRIARLVGTAPSVSHPPLNAIIYAYFSDLATTGYEWQFTPGVSAGYMPTNDDLVNVWIGYPAEQDRGDSEAKFWSMLSEASEGLAARTRSATRASGFKSTPGLTCFLNRPVGPGWALVGDAGCTIDPIGAHGISAALRDAELCAIAVDEALRDPDDEDGALERYRVARDDISLPLFRVTERLAGYGWDASEASKMLRQLSALAEREAAFVSALPNGRSVSPDGTPGTDAVRRELAVDMRQRRSEGDG